MTGAALGRCWTEEAAGECHLWCNEWDWLDTQNVAEEWWVWLSFVALKGPFALLRSTCT